MDTKWIYLITVINFAFVYADDDCDVCKKLLPKVEDTCFSIKSKWLLVQNCSIKSYQCSDRAVGALAGRCVASTHFEYPMYNCSMGRNEIATHLCFSGFVSDNFKAKYVGGVSAADVCSYNNPLGCRVSETDAYLECFRQISLNEFTRGIYEGLVYDYRRIYKCNCSVVVVVKPVLILSSLLWILFAS